MLNSETTDELTSLTELTELSIPDSRVFATTQLSPSPTLSDKATTEEERSEIKRIFGKMSELGGFHFENDAGSGLFRSYLGIVVPLTGTGKAGIVVTAKKPRSWSPTDISAAEKAAKILGVLASAYLRRPNGPRSDRSPRPVQDRARRLQYLSTALQGLATATEVANTVLEHVEALRLGQIVSLGFLSEEAETMRFIHGSKVPKPVADDWQETPIDVDIPMTISVRESRPVILENPAEIAGMPLFDVEAQRSGIVSIFSAPLRDSNDQIFGSIAIAQTSSIGVNADALHEVVGVVATALGRAIRFDLERERSRQLLRAVLPSNLPSFANLETAWSYLPASSHVQVGGDWYDILDLGEKAVLIVGDVAGHDLTATRTMAKLRHSLNAYLLAGRDPGRSLTLCTEMLETAKRKVFATVIIAVVHLETGQADFYSAGHPPPYIQRRGGLVERINLNPGPPVGSFESTYLSTTALLSHGDTVLLYTDGLVERRSVPLDASLDALASDLEDSSNQPDEICSQLATGSSDSDDDVVVLAARWSGPVVALM